MTLSGATTNEVDHVARAHVTHDSGGATDLGRAAEVGYRAEHSIESGVAAYIDWLKTNPQ